MPASHYTCTKVKCMFLSKPHALKLYIADGFYIQLSAFNKSKLEVKRKCHAVGSFVRKQKLSKHEGEVEYQLCIKA